MKTRIYAAPAVNGLRVNGNLSYKFIFLKDKQKNWKRQRWNIYV